MDSAVKSIEKFFGLNTPKKSTRKKSKLPVAPVVSPDEVLPVAKVIIPAPNHVHRALFPVLAKYPEFIKQSRLGPLNSRKVKKLGSKLKQQRISRSRESSPARSPLSKEVVILPNTPTSLGPNNYIEISAFGPIPNNFNGNSPTMDELIQKFKNFEKTRSKKR